MSFAFSDFNAPILRSIHSFGGKTGVGVAFGLWQFICFFIIFFLLVQVHCLGKDYGSLAKECHYSKSVTLNFVTEGGKC